MLHLETWDYHHLSSSSAILYVLTSSDKCFIIPVHHPSSSRGGVAYSKPPFAMGVKARRLHPLPFFDDPAVHQYFDDNGIKSMHIRKLQRRVLSRLPQKLESLEELEKERMIGIPPNLCRSLAKSFAITTSRVVEVSGVLAVPIVMFS